MQNVSSSKATVIGHRISIAVSSEWLMLDIYICKYIYICNLQWYFKIICQEKTHHWTPLWYHWALLASIVLHLSCSTCRDWGTTGGPLQGPYRRTETPIRGFDHFSQTNKWELPIFRCWISATPTYSGWWWLVVDLSRKMMEWKSVGMMTFPMYGKIKNVPNISKPPTSICLGEDVFCRWTCELLWGWNMTPLWHFCG